MIFLKIKINYFDVLVLNLMKKELHAKNVWKDMKLMMKVIVQIIKDTRKKKRKEIALNLMMMKR